MQYFFTFHKPCHKKFQNFSKLFNTCPKRCALNSTKNFTIFALIYFYFFYLLLPTFVLSPKSFSQARRRTWNFIWFFYVRRTCGKMWWSVDEEFSINIGLIFIHYFFLARQFFFLWVVRHVRNSQKCVFSATCFNSCVSTNMFFSFYSLRPVRDAEREFLNCGNSLSKLKTSLTLLA